MIRRVAWALLVLLLPITSLPLIARLAGSSAVAAPSALIAAAMVVVFLVPFLLRGGRLPNETRFLLAFVMAALISAAGAFFLRIPPFRNFNLLASELEALVTLAIGVCVYLAAATLLRDRPQLAQVLRWLNLAGLVILLWSAAQAVFWQLNNSYPDWMYRLQGLISASQNLYPQRVTGLAFEPSWLAHQLNMLFLPYWLAATVSRSTVHRRLPLGISVENILLAGGAACLVLSISRVGLLAFLVTVAFVMLEFNIWLVKWARLRLLHRFHQPWLQRIGPRLLPVILVLVLIVAYAGIFLGAGYMLTRIDYRMAKLFDPELLKEGNFTAISNQLAFAERVVFWDTGLQVFNDYPLLGVGPGNVGYFFPQKMATLGWALTEVSTLMYSLPSIPNVKSLWVRVLAENGILGFTLLTTWLIVIWSQARRLLRSRERLLQSVGWMGCLTIVALIIEGFSVDTYALPYFWLALGWTTAAAHLLHGEVRLD